MADPVIRTDRLTVRRGPVTALAGIDLTAPAGSLLAVLGHNGAGKSTLVGVLAGLFPPAAGTAWVCGIDVAADPAAVRRRIGVVGQQITVDESMTGHANLVLVARLLGASPRAARDRAAQLIEDFGLADVAGRPAKQCSGGQRRRLDLAAGLVGAPDVLLLDEPSTGLDPIAREGLWRTVDALVTAGTTVLLTTQYLEEADRLADDVVVLGAGRVVAAGSPEELKARFGQRLATVGLASVADQPRALAALRAGGTIAAPAPDGPATGRSVLTVPLDGGIPELVRLLDDAGIGIATLTVAEPTLDAVYRALLDPGARGRDGGGGATRPPLPRPARPVGAEAGR